MVALTHRPFLPPHPWSRDHGVRTSSYSVLLQLTEEKEAEDQDDRSSVALPSSHKPAPLQSRRLRQANSQEGRLWSRPPLNYFHLIALALRNSAPCGLNVQQIYSFTRYVPGGPCEEGEGRGQGPALIPSSWLGALGCCLSSPTCIPEDPSPSPGPGSRLSPNMCPHLT